MLNRISALTCGAALVAIHLLCASAQADEIDTIAAIKKAGTIRDCIDPEFPPEIYLKDGKPAGIAVDLAEAMAKSLGVTVTYVQSNFTGLIAGLQADKCDMAFSGVTARAKRAESVTFAKNYLLEVLGLAIRNGDARKEMADFDKPEAKICIVEGTSDDVALKQSFPKAMRVSLQDVNGCFLQLTSGKVDGFIVDNSTGGRFAADHPGALSMILTQNGGLQSVPSAIAVRRGDYVLQNWMNVFMAELIDGGGYETIYENVYNTKPDIHELKIARGGF
jgi:polar amino acid transport system substrate-binding protein